MKKFTVLGLVAAAMAFAPAAFAQGVVDGSRSAYHVPGEKLDSGLGSLTSKSMGAWANPFHVAGEKLDSGLGSLTAADLAPYRGTHVAGEKVDSGLGELTAADLAPYMGSHIAGEKLDSGLGELTAADLAPYMNPERSKSAIVRASY